MNASTAQKAVAANPNGWNILPAEAGQESTICAHTPANGGVTVTITADCELITVSIVHQSNTNSAIEALSTCPDETGFIGTPELVTSISECGYYLYSTIGGGAHIQVKQEVDGIVVDVIDTDGECVDTAAIFYSDLEAQGESE